ncbi:MAG: Molybdopterin molybdenumtransferase [Anaerolineales bacterium]|nr:Molybdopterin molybdenumtransferase [Anaerolineales bacterium]
MPQFLTLLPPDEARALLLSHLSNGTADSALLDSLLALGRVTAEDILAPHPLPEFPRSSMDGYAVRARDTFGASDSLPAYLTLIGEIPMGAPANLTLAPAQCASIHTGGMLPIHADAVVMLENTQTISGRGGSSDRSTEIEILRAVAVGENVIAVGEDVRAGQIVIPRGTLLREAEIGGLMALGITSLRVVRKPRVGLISSGDEVIEPNQPASAGQVRDVNAYTLSALVTRAGGEPVRYGIVRDDFSALQAIAQKALTECDAIIITAGSSASTRDMTADVIRSLGAPGVLVHGINTRPGKPTILGAADGKAAIGLPGNPVSALVNGYLFVVPVIEKLLGLNPRPRPTVNARLTVNLSSQAGREDWWPVKLTANRQPPTANHQPPTVNRQPPTANYEAEPIFGKSNLIFTLASADGLLKIPADATGLSVGEMVEVMLV